MIPSTDGWEIDTSVLVNCLDDDSTIFLETHPYYQPTTAGFYVKRYVESTNAYQGVLYTQIRNRETDHQLYLFKLPDTDNWMIGEVFGVDAGMAFVTDPAADPTGILNKRWRYVTSDGWLEENGNIICGKCQGFSLSTYSHENVYEVLRFARSIKFVPKGQNFVKLRNGIPMPYLGLGTGGIYREETFGVVSQALAKGYRVLDLAREYGNEHIIAEIFLATKDTPNFPRREEIFLETKVWPTDLGFLPTTDAIEASLRSLRTNYIDLYLIHWPR